MTTPLEKVLELQKQFDEAKKGAVQDLLSKRQEIDKQLAALGHGGAKTASKRPVDPTKKCTVCGKSAKELGVLKHDARSHRGEKKGKK